MQLKTSLSSLLFTGCLLASSAAVGEQISLIPSQDNTLIQRTDPANQLSNGAGDIFTGRTNQDGQSPATISIRRGLMQFDLGSIPAGATITGASLTLRDVMGLNGDPVTTLHRVLNSWGEGTSFQAGGMGVAAEEDDATWLYRYFDKDNSGDGEMWANPGGDFDPAVIASTVIDDNSGSFKFFTWTGPGLVDSVQFFLDNPGLNFGWLLQGDESRGQSAKRLNSRDSAFPPQLVIDYTVVPEPSSSLLLAVAMIGFWACKSKRKPRA